MPNYKLRDNPTFATRIDNNEETIYNYVVANPGSTQAQIVSGTGKAIPVVSELLMVFVAKGILVERPDIAGTAYHWEAGAWADLLYSNRVAARTWLSTNDGNTAGDMATDLVVHEAVARALAEGLNQEGLARLINV